MTAQSNLSPQQFFHGSRANLAVGDYVEAGHSPQWGASDPRYVCFTPEEKVAHGFARRVNPARGVQDPSGPPRIYTVEPTGKYTKDPDYEGPAFRSRKPLRVTAVKQVDV